MAKNLSINELIDLVKNGDFEEKQAPIEERLLLLNNNLIVNYAVIMAHCLLNEIPQENAEAVYNKRKEFFDKLIQIVNMNNYGRCAKMVEDIEAAIADVEADKVMWPSKKIKNNVLLFAVQYFIWDDKTRMMFFGAEESDFQQPGQEAAEVVEGEVVEA